MAVGSVGSADGVVIIDRGTYFWTPPSAVRKRFGWEGPRPSGGRGGISRVHTSAVDGDVQISESEGRCKIWTDCKLQGGVNGMVLYSVRRQRTLCNGTHLTTDRECPTHACMSWAVAHRVLRNPRFHLRARKEGISDHQLLLLGPLGAAMASQRAPSLHGLSVAATSILLAPSGLVNSSNSQKTRDKMTTG
jgi:hypothetical protein